MVPLLEQLNIMIFTFYIELEDGFLECSICLETYLIFAEHYFFLYLKFNQTS